MDREALKRTLTEKFQQSLEKALDAVEQAPDGRWIAASEWQVRELFQKLMSESYQQMLQAKMDAAPQAAFSPSGPAQAQEQGTSPRRQRADRRR
jgi:hypothetical protein